MDLEQALSSAMGGSLEALRTILKHYADQGGNKEEAYSILQKLRVEAVNDLVEDRILELMDIVSGFCSPHQRIW